LTFEELERSLPNGLHDAQLAAVHVDYGARVAILEINVDFSIPRAKLADDAFRAARLTFSGVQFIVIDPPGAGYEGFGISPVDAGSGQPISSPCALPPLENGMFLCWIFLGGLNAFLRIAAKDVTLEWQ
jgi:hypothetical protein